MSETRPLVSVSVPVYNAEKYLRQCLDSLVNQTLHDIEIVIVNDGSTDSSESICQEYAARDSRIVLVNKENGGSASARQTALDASRGVFFCSCDADDWVEPDMYEKMYQKAIETDADIVMCDYYCEYPDGKLVLSHYDLIPAKRKDLLDDALNGIFPCQLWNKLFKRDIFNRLALSFEPGIDLGEDFLLMMKFFRFKISVEIVSAPLYHYRREIGGNSYTNNVSMKTFRQSLYIRHWAKDNIDTVKHKNGMFRLWLSLAFTGLRVKEGMTGTYYRKEILSHIPFSGFFRYSYPKLKGCLALFAKLFGYRSARSVYKIVYKHFYH